MLIAAPTAFSDTLAGRGLLAALRAGGNVILMRHASSPRQPPDDTGSRGSWLKAPAAVAPAPGTNTLIMTHYPSIVEAYPQEAAGLADGEPLILHPDPGGVAHLIARLKINEGSSWDAGP